MADANIHTPSPVVGSLTQYNAKPFTGEESKDVLLRTRDAALRMVADEGRKPAPQSWKTLITHWLVSNSEAYNVWRRPDITDVDMFFKTLLERKEESST